MDPDQRVRLAHHLISTSIFKSSLPVSRAAHNYIRPKKPRQPILQCFFREFSSDAAAFTQHKFSSRLDLSCYPLRAATSTPLSDSEMRSVALTKALLYSTLPMSLAEKILRIITNPTIALKHLWRRVPVGPFELRYRFDAFPISPPTPMVFTEPQSLPRHLENPGSASSSLEYLQELDYWKWNA